MSLTFIRSLMYPILYNICKRTFTSIKYTRTHEYIKFNSSTNIATIGITKTGLSKLKYIIYADYSVNIGDPIERNDSIILLESSVASKDIVSPINGNVYDINKQVFFDSDLINTNSFDKGWLLKIKYNKELMNDTDLKLLDEDEYFKLISDEYYK
jgi:glycine cleavage system H protein|uniref:Lipoyl-binding domain-containing protein n=1 Tax=viral metagenome TaxID=1070528 RepID=A0A6C0ITC7_9ZZZZ